ncbi:MAG: membrane dipeptidase, partial [Myxococcales bacterium]|nr:membrane dipeptidase [Myxococcales bacterium]
MSGVRRYLALSFLALAFSGCESTEETAQPIVLPDPPANDGVFGYASGCYAMQGFSGKAEPTHLAASAGGDAYEFSAALADSAAHFRMRATDLGTYLFYDKEQRYFTAQAVEGSEPTKYEFVRASELQDSVQLLDDSFRSPAEWEIEVSERDAERFQLKHYQSGLYLTLSGLTDDAKQAAIITLFPEEDCATFPELELDAEGTPTKTQWDDGDLYGIAEIHSHIFTNFGFGGGGIYHGSPFHRLGVEHALPDCSLWHGQDGKRDIVGYFYDNDTGLGDITSLIPILTSGEVPVFNHETTGYPDFTAWPNSWNSSTHQTMYYRWIERAYLAGLRLVVNLATGNSVLCDLVRGTKAQEVRYSCNDMVSVERTIEETKNLERYIDAQSGGPGKGWFKVVTSPAEAREAIKAGKLAVVLGIEISNVFDCFLTPPDGFETCSEDTMNAALDRYQELGVRVVFPVHKYDNGFTAGDGSNGIIELGNVINSGHYTSKVQDCPGIDVTFDHGGVTFGGLNKPRDAFDSEPPLDMSGFADNVVTKLLPLLGAIQEPALEGEYCQKFGLTPLGEKLILGLMKRGMIPDIAHLPQRSLERVYEMLDAADYPATKTHGGSNDGHVYALGGMRGADFGRCADPNDPGNVANGLRNSLQEITMNGGYPAEGLSFDLNGFAGGPRPRFGDNSPCGGGQDDATRVSYPFTSFDGSVTFSPPHLGNRDVDFNTEGMLHIGLLPEYIQDARNTGVDDETLEPM